MEQDGKRMDAQDLIVQDIQRLKEDTSELYGLDREKSKLIMELNGNVKKIVVEQEVIKKDVNELKTRVANIETSTAKTTANVEKLQEDMKVVKETVTNKQWQPKDIAVIVVAVLSLITSVSVALIAALIK